MEDSSKKPIKKLKAALHFILGITAVAAILKTAETFLDMGEISLEQYTTLEKGIMEAKNCPAAKERLREYLSDSKISQLELTRLGHARGSCKLAKKNMAEDENTKENTILRLKEFSERQ